jgi:TRAP-type uncharacterized transport system substrate-binding protein
MKRQPFLIPLTAVILLLIFAAPLTVQTAAAREPQTVIFQTTQFGRAFYDYAFALEELTRKSGSWVQVKAEETPGAMFMIKSLHDNIGNMRSGKKPWVIQYASTNSASFIKYGWPPFTKIRVPGYRVFSTILCRINILATFDEDIKSAKDLAGKRVAVATKAAPFNSTLKYVPYFEKGLGVDVNWQFIGIGQGKDALLNGTVDATVCTFTGEYQLASDGITFNITKASADSPTMELLASGRKLRFISFDPKVLMSTYKGEKMMVFSPAVIKAGATDGVDGDITGLCEFLYLSCDEKMPDDIVTELLKVRLENAKKFGDYHAMFKMQPENPFPAGAPKSLVHPAVYGAAKKLGFKVVE